MTAPPLTFTWDGEAPPAAFRAIYSDWKLIRTRGVVQVVMEIPLEVADAAYRVLGGMPNPGESAWFAIARLDPEKVTATKPAADKKRWHDMPAAQQAGILCAHPAFITFLREQYRDYVVDEASAKKCIHELCEVSSRSQLTADHPRSLRYWNDMVAEYRAWVREPEVVG